MGVPGSGRHKLPTVMKVLKGTLRKDRANPNEPMPEVVKIPKKPVLELGASGMKEWERMTSALIDIGVLTNFDYSALEVYCLWFGKLVDANKVLIEEGKNISERAKIAKREISEATEYVHKFGVLFGFAPSPRARLSVETKKKKSALDEI